MRVRAIGIAAHAAWASLLLILICPYPTAFGQAQPPSQSFTVTAGSARAWQSGRWNVVLLSGPVSIETDETTMSADSAVIWLAPALEGVAESKEAQIALVTKYNTEVRWGRPINAKDFYVEISTAQKLQTLQDVWQKFHRVDAGQRWIDIRFDKTTYPSDRTAQADSSR